MQAIRWMKLAATAGTVAAMALCASACGGGGGDRSLILLTVNASGTALEAVQLRVQGKVGEAPVNVVQPAVPAKIAFPAEVRIQLAETAGGSYRLAISAVDAGQRTVGWKEVEGSHPAGEVTSIAVSLGEPPGDAGSDGWRPDAGGRDGGPPDRVSEPDRGPRPDGGPHPDAPAADGTPPVDRPRLDRPSDRLAPDTRPADSGPAICEHGETKITTSTVWPACIHVLNHDLEISGGTLEVAACSTIRMPAAGTINVRNGGALRLVGRPDCPITVTSGKASPARGDWHYLAFYSSGNLPDNVFRHVVVEYGGGSYYGAVWVGSNASLEMQNSTVRQSENLGIELEADGSLRNFQDNALSGNAGGPIAIAANHVGELGPGTYSPNDVEGVQVLSGDVERDAAWLPLGTPYVAADGFSVKTTAGSARLTLQAGTTLKLGPAASILVGSNGALTLDGAPGLPVTVTSAKAAPAAGDWDYIDFRGSSMDSGNIVRNTVVEYGGGSYYGQLLVENGASVEVSDSIVRHSAELGIEVQGGGGLRNFKGNTVQHCAQGGVSVPANNVDQLGPGTYGPNAVEGILVDLDYSSDAVDHSCTWADLGTPLVAPGGFEVDSGLLTVAGGVTLKLGAGAAVIVRRNASLKLDGAPGKRVTVTSAKALPSPGDWDEISLHSKGNLFRHTDISYGGGSYYGQVYLYNNSALDLDHVVFSNTGECDLDVAESATVNLIETQAIRCE